MSNATIALSTPSTLYQYIAVKWKEGLNLYITSMNICWLFFAVIVACVSWYKKRSWRSIKICSFINVLLSITMYNVLKLFLDSFGPVPKTLKIVFLSRLFVSSFTWWFMIMSWSTFVHPIFPLFSSFFLASAVGWSAAVGYSALYTYLREDLFYFTIVAALLSYFCHCNNVITIIKILNNKTKYENVWAVLRMLLYTSAAFIIMLFLHVSEDVPRWSDTLWIFISAIQLIFPIVFICSGELCKLYRILLDKDNTERYIDNESFELNVVYMRCICPVIVCYYDIAAIAQSKANQRKAGLVPNQDGNPKVSNAGRFQYYQDGRPRASNAGHVQYYQYGRPRASNAGRVQYYQDGRPRASNAGRVQYYQNGNPKAPNEPLKCECPNVMITFSQDTKF